MEAKVRRLGLRLGGEKTPTGFQQLVSAHNIGAHKGFRAVDGTINMAFGSQMHDGIWGVICKNPVESSRVTDIYLAKMIVWIFLGLAQGGEIASVGQLIDVNDLQLWISQRLSNDTATNEACAASNEYFHRSAASG